MFLEDMETWTKWAASKHKHISLRHIKTGKECKFSLMTHKDIDFLNCSLISEFPADRLEVEYDYDTDMEQCRVSKRMLASELAQAIDFFIKDDPIKLVDNVLL